MAFIKIYSTLSIFVTVAICSSETIPLSSFIGSEDGMIMSKTLMAIHKDNYVLNNNVPYWSETPLHPNRFSIITALIALVIFLCQLVMFCCGCVESDELELNRMLRGSGCRNMRGRLASEYKNLERVPFATAPRRNYFTV